MPEAVGGVSRRRLLAGGVGLALLAGTASACGSAPAPPAFDELQSQLELARHDSELAAAAAVAAPPLTAALSQVAFERSEHADALAAEIARVTGGTAVNSTETSTPTTSGSSLAHAPSVSDVVSALRISAHGASQLATESSGYQAGLLGSIAAACTAAYTVTLVTGEPRP